MDRSNASASELGLNALGRQIVPGADLKQRVLSAFCDTAFWHSVVADLGRLAKTLESYAQELNGVIERIDGMSEDVDKQIVYLNTELGAVQGRILATASGLAAFVSEDESACRWIEGVHRGKRGPSIAFCRAPISVAPWPRAESGTFSLE